ncbi:hypothetical protein J6590_083866, partial [Homalodisca vitripennis]
MKNIKVVKYGDTDEASTVGVLTQAIRLFLKEGIGWQLSKSSEEGKDTLTNGI